MKLIEKVILIFLFIINISMLFQFKKSTSGTLLRDVNARKCATNMIENALNNKLFYQQIIKFFGINGFPTIKIKYKLTKLLPCVNSYPMFLNNNTKGVLGYVIPMYNKKNIFINGKYWHDLTLINKATLLIHECTHLILNTEDYAYEHDVYFLQLKSKKALQNADTIKQIITVLSDNKC